MSAQTSSSLICNQLFTLRCVKTRVTHLHICLINYTSVTIRPIIGPRYSHWPEDKVRRQGERRRAKHMYQMNLSFGKPGPGEEGYLLSLCWSRIIIRAAWEPEDIGSRKSEKALGSFQVGRPLTPDLFLFFRGDTIWIVIDQVDQIVISWCKGGGGQN
jgi:hypothetical protein